MNTMKCVTNRLREVVNELEAGAELADATERIEMVERVKWEKVFDYAIRSEPSGFRTLSVTWKPLVKVVQERKGCKGCEYFLNTFDSGNKKMRPCCNHPKNIQPRVRNFQRQKPLSMGWFPSWPAWCKLEEK